MNRLSDKFVTSLDYEQALNKFNYMAKVRGYPESYRRWDTNYRVAIKDDTDGGGYIDFWQLGSGMTCRSINMFLYHDVDTDTGKFLKDNPKPKHSFGEYRGDSYNFLNDSYWSVVRVYKSNHIMASTGHHATQNAFGRDFVALRLGKTYREMVRTNTYDYLDLGGDEFYCSNYEGLAIVDGYITNAYRPKMIRGERNFFTMSDCAIYCKLMKPFYEWLVGVISTCTDGEIPEFEPIGCDFNNWDIADISGYIDYIKTRLANNKCDDTDYLNLTCFLLHYAHNTYQGHGALDEVKKWSGTKKKFLPMDLIRHNVSKFFTLNDTKKRDKIYRIPEFGKRAWGKDYPQERWIHLN